MKRLGVIALFLLLGFSVGCSRRNKDLAHVTPLLSSSALRNPIVLVHGATEKGSTLKIGMFGFGAYFHDIEEFYKSTGTPVYTVELSTDGSIEERAAVLKSYLETNLRGQGVNIVAHSLGGLDARYAVSNLATSQILSITTIGTPHLGTPLADWAARQIDHGYPWYWFFRLLGYDMKHRRFLKEITTSFMANTFNPRTLDSSEVRYFSVIAAGSYDDNTMSYLLWFPSLWLENEKHPMAQEESDGMVPKSSQKHGKVIGEFRMDHLAEINHQEFRVLDLTEASLALYRGIFENLSHEGL